LKRKKELDRAERARREREKKSVEARRIFQSELEEFFAQANEGKLKESADHMLNNFEVLLKKAVKSKSAKQYETALIVAETQALKELNQLRKSCLIKKPRGFGLTKELKHDWEFYLVELDRLEDEIFSQTEIRIDKLVNDAVKKSKHIFDRCRRSVELLNEIITAHREGLEREIKDTHKAIAETKNRIVNLTREILTYTKSTISDIEDEFQRKNIEKLSQNKLHGLRQKYENIISMEVSRYTEILSYIRAQLQRIDWSRDEDGQIIGEAEMTAALEDELLEFRERSEADLELIQLGMAIDIINHEFNSSVKAIRNQLKRLKDWTDVNGRVSRSGGEQRAFHRAGHPGAPCGRCCSLRLRCSHPAGSAQHRITLPGENVDRVPEVGLGHASARRHRSGRWHHRSIERTPRFPAHGIAPTPG